VPPPDGDGQAAEHTLDVALRAHDGLDPDWDAFVERAPGGHHVQTTRWAEVKRTVGWRAVRVEVRRRGELTGGLQLLLRRIGGLGSVGFVPRGPVVGHDAGAGIVHVVLDNLETVARDERVLHLKVQPPAGSEDTVATLRRRGYRESGLETAPTATVLVDLGRDLEEIFAGMRTNTRRNVRRALKSGVTVRVGDARDIGILHELLRATARRQRFAPYPERYYRAMWDLFSPSGHAHVLVAERGGTPISALLLIAFRDTALYKIGGWSGDARDARPNALMHWTAIEWAKHAGHRWYDLEGIDLDAACAVADGRDPPAGTDGVTRFKLGFGGDVAIFPPALNHSGLGIAGRAVGELAPGLERLSPIAARMLGRRG
jgi:lipid II:glycine glycyltransferase (peptidoglycan interpeptide bridge formation enzyme)